MGGTVIDLEDDVSMEEIYPGIYILKAQSDEYEHGSVVLDSDQIAKMYDFVYPEHRDE